MTGSTVDDPRPALELHSRAPAVDDGRPPILFVHGLGHGAWSWEHWLGAAADAGYSAHAISLRGPTGTPTAATASPPSSSTSCCCTSRPAGRSALEFPGMGHDLMLDARWREPFDAMLGWLRTAVPAA